MKLATSSEIARNKQLRVHPLLPPTLSRIRETTSIAELAGQSSATFTQAPTENFKTGVLHGPENLFVAGSVEEHPCQITIDTGSNISIIRPDVLSKQEQIRIQPVTQSLRTVTGEKAPIQGRGDLHVRIGSQEAVHPMWIADIQDECILGLDFLELHGCMVDLRDSVLHISGEEVPLQKTGSCNLVLLPRQHC